MAVFTTQDGLALGSKTPVSILQETLQKKGITPTYELIYNGVGMQNPIFKFQVSVEGVTAIGDGKTKKEAKHDAAASLLKRLLANGEEAVEEPNERVDIASPYTGALKANYIGMLDELCYTNKIPLANYVLVLEDGPPHARVFTMKCVVSSISETAVARTKKQAKHLVAQKMIDRVERILKDRFIPVSANEEATEEIVSGQEKIRNGSFHHDLSHKVKDLHNVFHHNREEQPLPAIFLELPNKEETFYEYMEKPLEFLQEVIEALEGVVKTNYITEEECMTSFKEMVDQFINNDEEDSKDDIEKEDEIKDVNVSDKFDFDSILPELPLSDDDENEHTTSVKDVVNQHKFYDPDDSEEDSEDHVEKEDEMKENMRDRLDYDVILPPFPLSEDEEDEKSENLVSDLVEEMKRTSIHEDSAAFSIIKVEVPRGLWEFAARGKSESEALDRAARKAIKFLRLMAIPPHENFL